MSDDGKSAIVVIALLGNPFSPSYARARAKTGIAPPLDFCALNVCLYGLRGASWSLRERAVVAAPAGRAMSLGSSRLEWSGDGLRIDIDERTTPFGKRLRGYVRLLPEICSSTCVDLDAEGNHQWWPRVPRARIEVQLAEPAIRFSGEGYHDANAGRTPLEDSFASWTWARARVQNRALVTYDVTARTGETRARAYAFGADGTAHELDDLVRHALPTSRWGLPREARGDRDARVRLVRSLEDGPFYARDIVATRLLGSETLAVHETLSGDRLARGWVRFLAGFRMGRAA